MSNQPATRASSAAGIREENAALDRDILGIDIPPALIHQKPLPREDDPDPWSIAEQLCHIAEFPRFFGGQLKGWFDNPNAVIGRTHEHNERLAAIEAAAGRGLTELLEDIINSAEGLASTLVELDDDHLAKTTNNVKYGSEPLTAFLDRYLIGHKRAHLKQLRETLKAVETTAT